MRISSNIHKPVTRRNQFSMLVEIIYEMGNKKDLSNFLECLLTSSELSYIGQRLDVIKMLAKNFNYIKIKNELNVSNSTIAHAQQCLDLGGDKLIKTILSCKFTPAKENLTGSSFSRGNGLVSPRMPGTICTRKSRE